MAKDCEASGPLTTMGTFPRSVQLHIKLVMEILMRFDGTVCVFKIGAVIWNDFPKCVCGMSLPPHLPE